MAVYTKTFNSYSTVSDMVADGWTTQNPGSVATLNTGIIGFTQYNSSGTAVQAGAWRTLAGAPGPDSTTPGQFVVLGGFSLQGSGHPQYGDGFNIQLTDTIGTNSTQLDANFYSVGGNSWYLQVQEGLTTSVATINPFYFSPGTPIPLGLFYDIASQTVKVGVQEQYNSVGGAITPYWYYTSSLSYPTSSLVTLTKLFLTTGQSGIPISSPVTQEIQSISYTYTPATTYYTPNITGSTGPQKTFLATPKTR